ncbi:MAG: penicillin-binding protein 2 [Alphaproteobacteria bacterium]|nr:penicillin-binding protein 2 [Alphaproteobacteria bacterium]
MKHLKDNTAPIMGQRSGALGLAHGRVYFLMAIFVLAFFVITVRVYDLMLLQGAFNEEAKTKLYERRMAETVEDQDSAKRADIIDRNGVLLATSLKITSLYADPKIMVDPPETAQLLTKIFPDLSYGDLLKKFEDKKKRFVWLKRNITPAQQNAIMYIGDPGLAFRDEYKRFYPQGSLTSHLVGFTNIDGKGLAGIERSYNSILRSNAATDEPLRLTVDTRLQHILRREVEAAQKDFSGIGSAGLIMEAKTGNILAAVSLPDFDPQHPQNSESAPMFNRVFQGVYEMGSTFKIFSTAALLETKNIGLGQTFDVRQPLKRGNFTIKDFHPENRILTLPEVFMYSSNIGTALMGEMTGTANLKSFYRKLGFFDKPVADLDEVGQPLYPKNWRELNTLTATYGHGVAVSPLQVTGAVATIVNGGTKVMPSLVQAPDIVQAKEKISSAPRVVSAQTSENMRRLMRLVVTNGTGRKADVEGFEVGGKTGTAEKIVGGRYDHNKRVASFVAAFPIEEPEYVVFVMVDEPKPNKKSYGYATAGWVAAPAAARVISNMGSVLGMPAVEVAHDAAEPLLQYVSTKGGHE